MTPELKAQIEARDLSDSETLRSLLDYCRELEALHVWVESDEGHCGWTDSGNALQLLASQYRKVRLLEAALDWCQERFESIDLVWTWPPHLDAILEASRKRIIGSAGTGTGSDKT